MRRAKRKVTKAERELMEQIKQDILDRKEIYTLNKRIEQLNQKRRDRKYNTIVNPKALIANSPFPARFINLCKDLDMTTLEDLSKFEAPLTKYRNLGDVTIKQLAVLDSKGVIKLPRFELIEGKELHNKHVRKYMALLGEPIK